MAQRDRFWTELNVTGEGVSATLYSERDDTVTVEDETWLTWSELENSRGSQFILESGDLPRNPNSGELLDFMGLTQDLPEPGDTVHDTDPPHWAEDNRLFVEEVLESVRADEYVVDGPNEESVVLKNELQSPLDKTVADENPSFPEDDPIVVAKYIKESGGFSDEYAFPISRLEE